MSLIFAASVKVGMKIRPNDRPRAAFKQVADTHQDSKGFHVLYIDGTKDRFVTPTAVYAVEAAPLQP